MEVLVEFVKNWGYIAVFLGAMVEGESIILTASSLAYFGYLDIYKVGIVAFISTLFTDQGLYYLGRYYGQSFFDRYPRLKPAASKAFKFLHRFDIWFILFFRFIYGIRTISPIVIGAGKVSPYRFTPLNLVSAIIWTVISCWGGYTMGNVMMEIFENIHLLQKYFFVIILMIIGLVGAIWWYKKKKK